MQETFLKYMKLIHLAEKLKMELRHSWLSDGRQESVAEHSWRMALMVILFAPHLDQKIDVEKALKMALIHDLVEAEAGDVPIFETGIRKDLKQVNEQKAIMNIKNLLSDAIGDEIFQLWNEYEEKQTYEAKFINGLDKLEVLIQHNEADISTWLPWEKQFNVLGAAQFCDFDRCLFEISKLVQEEAIKKIALAENMTE